MSDAVTASARPERLPGLDALRGVAALAVVAFHFTTRFGIVFGHPERLTYGVPWGQRGVELFFVISGFAIELSLARACGAGHFLRARLVRLYPTFWAAVLLTFAVVSAFGLPEREVSPIDALINLTMIPASLGVPAVDAVYWTLERELRFYALALVLLAFGLHRSLAPVLIAAVALQTIGVIVDCVPSAVWDLLNLGWAHLFACGALLARLHRAPSRATLLLLLLCLASSRALGEPQAFYATLAVGLVGLAIRAPSGRWLGPLAFVGRISYPLYLVHQYVGYVALRALYAHGAPAALALAVTTALSFAAATALHLMVERPCLAWLGRTRRATSGGHPATLASGY